MPSTPSLMLDDGTMSVRAAKTALRKSMLRTLRSLSEEETQQQSQAVAKILFESPFFHDARSIACYVSMPKAELRTRAIVEEILRRDKHVYIPHLPANGDMDMLRLYSKEDLENSPVDKWGILDPGTDRHDVQGSRENALESSLDLILVPGVAFDKDINRMGRGKGYYDRFLSRYTAAKGRPLIVALALSCQLLPDEKVPVNEDDFRLDGIISPEGLTWRPLES